MESTAELDGQRHERAAGLEPAGPGSVFVRTRLVQPGTLAVRIRRYF